MEIVERLYEEGKVVHEYSWYNQNEDHRELNDELTVAVYDLDNQFYWLGICNDGKSVALLTGRPVKFNKPKADFYPNPGKEEDDARLCLETFGVEFVAGTYVHDAF
jgi:hypothetical protein